MRKKGDVKKTLLIKKAIKEMSKNFISTPGLGSGFYG